MAIYKLNAELELHLITELTKSVLTFDLLSREISDLFDFEVLKVLVVCH